MDLSYTRTSLANCKSYARVPGCMATAHRPGNEGGIYGWMFGNLGIVQTFVVLLVARHCTRDLIVYDYHCIGMN